MLLLVSGASGMGKSTAKNLLKGKLPDSVQAVELADLTSIPDAPDVKWRQQAAEIAVTRALELAPSGHLLLSGDPVAPAEVLAAPSAAKLDIAICLLDAEPWAQTARLAGRGDPAALLPQHNAFATWMREHAKNPHHVLEALTTDGWEEMRWDRLDAVSAGDPRWRIPVIDTTDLDKPGVAEAVLDWVNGAVVGIEPTFAAGWFEGGSASGAEREGDPAQFSKDFWEEHWEGGKTESMVQSGTEPNPYVVDVAARLSPGTVLDAGCGVGTEAIYLAGCGWDVLGADVSGNALATAAEHARQTGDAMNPQWIETDLGSWHPEQQWDLVVTCYAHPEGGQLAFFERVAGWVAPGGTLLIVGHEHGHSAHHSAQEHGLSAHDDGAEPALGPAWEPPEEATVTLEDMVALFDSPAWRIDSAAEHEREVKDGAVRLHDVVLRATRLEA